jgi:hypothetical protein
MKIKEIKTNGISEKVEMLLILSIWLSGIAAFVYAPFSHMVSVITCTQKISVIHNMPDWIKLIGFITGALILLWMCGIDYSVGDGADCEGNPGAFLVAGSIGGMISVSIYFVYQMIPFVGKLLFFN